LLFKNENKHWTIQAWYYYFGITNLKKDSTLLVKKTTKWSIDNTLLAKEILDKKLSVFFIPNLNMIISKWLFSIIYEKYYKKKMYIKKKKYNLAIMKLMFNVSNINLKNIILIKEIKKLILYYKKYIYNYSKKIKVVIYLKKNYLFNFKNNFEIIDLLKKNIKKKQNVKKIWDTYIIEDYFLKIKEKKNIKLLIKNIYIKNIKKLKLKLQKGVKLWLKLGSKLKLKEKENIIKKKKNILLNIKIKKLIYKNKVLFGKKNIYIYKILTINKIINFIILKKILIKVQLLKLLKEIKKKLKDNKNNGFCLWF